jgi:hypothetical protein
MVWLKQQVVQCAKPHHGISLLRIMLCVQVNVSTGYVVTFERTVAGYLTTVNSDYSSTCASRPARHSFGGGVEIPMQSTAIHITQMHVNMQSHQSCRGGLLSCRCNLLITSGSTLCGLEYRFLDLRSRPKYT